jgi:hypothetical protein
VCAGLSDIKVPLALKKLNGGAFFFWVSSWFSSFLPWTFPNQPKKLEGVLVLNVEWNLDAAWNEDYFIILQSRYLPSKTVTLTRYIIKILSAYSGLLIIRGSFIRPNAS